MTIISHKHRFIFVRPQKVASSSMMVALSNLCGNEDIVSCNHGDRPHFQARNVHVFQDLSKRTGRASPGGHILPQLISESLDAEVWQEYFKFTVVRNPWDWFVSLYAWKLHRELLRGRWLPRQASLRRHLFKMREKYRLRWILPDFELGRHKENIELIFRRKWFDKMITAMPAFYFIQGRPYADYYLRFENLQEDYARLLHLLKLSADPKTLPAEKVIAGDENRNYRSYYTDWSRNQIACKCRQVIDAFGYRF